MTVMRTAIALSAALISSGASAQGIDLSGPWQCVAVCAGPPGGFAYITQNGWDLNLVNEAGMPSRASMTMPVISGSSGPTKAQSIRLTASRCNSIVERFGSAPRWCRLLLPACSKSWVGEVPSD